MNHYANRTLIVTCTKDYKSRVKVCAQWMVFLSPPGSLVLTVLRSVFGVSLI